VHCLNMADNAVTTVALYDNVQLSGKLCPFLIPRFVRALAREADEKVMHTTDDNPFKIPSDTDVFVAREREKASRAAVGYGIIDHGMEWSSQSVSPDDYAAGKGPQQNAQNLGEANRHSADQRP